MDLQLEKLKLIEWLIQLNDTKMLSKLISIKNGESFDDELLESIKQGLEDTVEGRVIPHSEVRKKYEKWL